MDKKWIKLLLALGVGFVFYKKFAGEHADFDDDDEETSRSIDIVDEAIQDLRRDEAFEEIEPEDEELDEMVEDVHY